MFEKINIFWLSFILIFLNFSAAQAVNTNFVSSPTIGTGASINFTPFGSINGANYIFGTSKLDSAGSSYFMGGNVGVGTTAPGAKLDVTGDTIITGSLFQGALNQGKINLLSDVVVAQTDNYFRLYVPQTYNDTRNGGTATIRVVWGQSHAGITYAKEYKLVFGTNHAAAPGYLYVSSVTKTYDDQDPSSYSGYPMDQAPAVDFYQDTTGGYINFNVKGYNEYNRHRIVSIEIDGGGVATPVLSYYGATSPGGSTLTVKDIPYATQASYLNTIGLYYQGGNVGIGTTTPGKLLDVNGQAIFRNFAYGTTPASTDILALSTVEYVNGKTGGSGGVGTGTSGQTLRHNGTGWVANSTLFNDGTNVGIGTTGPLSKLDIRGALVIPSGLTNADSRPAVGTSRISGEISGVGANGVLGANDGFLRLSAGGGSAASQKSFIDLSGYSQVADMNENIIFGTAGSEAMRINSLGNVGIGTTNPGQKLEVNGKVQSTGFNNASTIQTVKGLTWSRIVNLNPVGVLGASFIVNISGTRNSVVWNSTWQVTSGHSSYGTLTLLSSNNYTPTRLRLVVDGNGDGYLEFYDQGYSATLGVDQDIYVTVNNLIGTSAVLTSFQDGTTTTGYTVMPEATSIPGGLISQGGGLFAGNVGIGTTTPGKLLDVNGQAIFRNFAYGTTPASTDILALSTVEYVNGKTGGSGGVGTGTSGQTLRHNGTGWIANSTLFNDGTNVGIGTTGPSNLLTVGTGSNSDTSVLPTLRLQGYNISDGSHGYGAYGGMILNSGSAYTASARRFLITNALNVNKFGIIRSTDATTDPALGTAGVITSGTADFVIDNTGNVGIGTTGPDVKLTINTADNYLTTGIYAKFQGLSNQRGLEFGQLFNGVNDSFGYIQSRQDSTTVQHLLLNPYGGNVGIGTTTPESGSKLDVNGNGTIGTQGSARIYLGTIDATNAYIQARDTSINQKLTFYASSYNFSVGNVGIGTITPGKLLEVNGQAKFNNFAYGTTPVSTDLLALSTVEYVNGKTGGSGGVGTGTSGQTLRHNGTGWVANSTLFNDGTNVGIGTAASGSKLEIYESTGSKPAGVVAANKTVLKLSRYGTPGYSYYEDAEFRIGHGGPGAWGTNLDLYVNGGANTSGIPDQQTMTWAYNGNVGIGTTNPTALLQLSRSPGAYVNTPILNVIPETNWGIKLQQYHNGGGYDYYLMQNNGSATDVPLFTFKQGGNVGIGTTNNIASTLTVKSPNIVDGTGQYGTVLIASNNIEAIDKGGTLSLGGDYSSVSPGVVIPYASISGRKENSLDGHAAGYLQFSTVISNGIPNEKMRITSLGNVGIGTTNPTAKLMVSGAGVWTGAVISLVNTGPSGRRWDIFSTDTAFDQGAGKLLFYNNTSGSNAMIIDSSNNVGIGTTTPGKLLDVNGQAIFRNFAYGTTPVSTDLLALSTVEYVNGKTGGSGGVGTGTNGQTLRHNGTGWVANSTLFNDGTNVGIGTAAPFTKLTLPSTYSMGWEEAASVNPDPRRWWAGNDLIVYGDWGLGTATTKGAATPNLWRLYINNLGNVGIGTTNPGDKLGVSGGNITIDNSLSVGGVDGSGLKLFGDIGNKPYRSVDFVPFVPTGSAGVDYEGLKIYTANGTTNRVNALTILPGGNVGIGTASPVAPLSLFKSTANPAGKIIMLDIATVNSNAWWGTDKPTINFRTGYGGGTTIANLSSIYSYLQNSGTDVGGEMMFQTANALGTLTDRMVIDKSGNVGIGTAAPYTRLSINNNASEYNSANSKISVYADAASTYGIGFGKYTNYGVGIYAGDSFTAAPKVFVESTGNVGIGTIAPGKLLEVNGQGKFDSFAYGTTPAGTDTLALTTVEYVNGILAGGIVYHRTNVTTSPYIALATDYIIAYNGPNGGTITLPVALCNSGTVGVGRAYEITNESTFTVTVTTGDPTVSKISGNTQQALAPYNSIPVYCNGTSWFIY